MVVKSYFHVKELYSRFCRRKIRENENKKSPETHKNVRFAELSMYTVTMASRSPSFVTREVNINTNNQTEDIVKSDASNSKMTSCIQPTQWQTKFMTSHEKAKTQCTNYDIRLGTFH